MVDRDVTALLVAANHGDTDAASLLMPLVYDELHRRAAAIMRHETPGHTLQATALVHEAYLRLIQQDRVDWRARNHFFAVASQMMRRVLVDHARGRQRDKRGGGIVKISLDESHGLSVERDADVLALELALNRLAELDPQQAEIVVMRFYGGLTVDEVAAALDVSKRTVEAEWTMVKAWLRRELMGD